MIVGIVNSAVVVQMKCRELMSVFRQREPRLREACLVSAVIAEFEAGAVEMGVYVIYKMEESLIFKANIDVRFLRDLDEGGNAIHSYLRDGRIVVARGNVPYRAGNAVFTAFDEIVTEHFVSSLTLEGISPEVVDVVPGGLAVVDLKTDSADDLDLTVVVKGAAETDEDGVKARSLDSLEHSCGVSILLARLNSVLYHSLFSFNKFAVRLRRS